MKILLADDHHIVFFGLEKVLSDIYPGCSIDRAMNFSVVKSMISERQYQLLILDLNMPGLNQLNCIAAVKKIDNEVPILIYSSYKESIYASPCMKAGANGYISKERPYGELAEAILQIVERGVYHGPALTADENVSTSERSSENAGMTTGKLSRRELEVFTLLVQGEGILEISNTLNLSISSVCTYKKRLFTKLHVSNIAELISIASI